VHFTCADAGSGIPANACPADQILSTEGPAIASTARTVTDAAGNTSDPSNVITVAIDKTATVTLGSLSATYTGSPQAVTATTVPGGLTVNLTYNGSPAAPTAAGSYTVVGTVSDPNYHGSGHRDPGDRAGDGARDLRNLSPTYTGSAQAATATHGPRGSHGQPHV